MNVEEPCQKPTVQTWVKKYLPNVQQTSHYASHVEIPLVLDLQVTKCQE